ALPSQVYGHVELEPVDLRHLFRAAQAHIANTKLAVHVMRLGGESSACLGMDRTSGFDFLEERKRLTQRAQIRPGHRAEIVHLDRDRVSEARSTPGGCAGRECARRYSSRPRRFAGTRGHG